MIYFDTYEKHLDLIVLFGRQMDIISIALPLVLFQPILSEAKGWVAVPVPIYIGSFTTSAILGYLPKCIGFPERT